MIRRHLLAGGTVAAAAALLGPRLATAEPPPATTAIRLGRVPSVCLARQYVAEPLLRAEGFYAPRLREAGMVNGNPQKLIAEGTVWRILDQLKRELKG